MPKAGSKSNKTQTQTQTQNKENTTMSTLFTELDDAEVVETQSQTRSRGDYDGVLADFIASDSRGWRISAEGVLEGKKAPAMKSGLENACKRMEKHEAGSAASIKVVLFKNGTGDDATQEVRLLNSNAGQ